MGFDNSQKLRLCLIARVGCVFHIVVVVKHLRAGVVRHRDILYHLAMFLVRVVLTWKQKLDMEPRLVDNGKQSTAQSGTPISTQCT